jgi:hypothetical protein
MLQTITRLPKGYFFWHITVNSGEIDMSEHCLKCLTKRRQGIRFSEADIPEGFPNSDDPLYRTCRNWQFAHRLKNHTDRK